MNIILVAERTGGQTRDKGLSGFELVVRQALTAEMRRHIGRSSHVIVACREESVSIELAQFISNRLSDGRIFQEEHFTCKESPDDAFFNSAAELILHLKAHMDVIILVVPAATAGKLPRFIGKEMQRKATFPDMEVKEGEVIMIDTSSLTCKLMSDD